jgi:hypothetical protein
VKSVCPPGPVTQAFEASHGLAALVHGPIGPEHVAMLTLYPDVVQLPAE